MSFRKRNVVIGNPTSTASGNPSVPRPEKKLASGVRPSPFDGRLTTSTGTSSFDQLLAGHAGLALGTSLLIEEAGTTDFGGTLLRYFAAEGLVQGHHVHVLGYGDAWRRDLPGLASPGRGSKSSKKDTQSEDKMKIAWRYETLGTTSSRNGSPHGKSTPACSAFWACRGTTLTKPLAQREVFHMKAYQRRTCFVTRLICPNA